MTLKEINQYIKEYAADMRESLHTKRQGYDAGFIAGQEFACMTIYNFINDGNATKVHRS